MLKRLRVKNIALIQDIELEFGEGLNILTGETGAGKSILIDCISLALGARLTGELKNSADGFVELCFKLDVKSTKRLENIGFSCEGDELVLTRTISGGKSGAKIGDESVTLSRLREISRELIDIYAQHESASLLDESTHIEILDSYAGDEIASVRAEYDERYAAYRKALKARAGLDEDEGTRSRDMDFLSFQISEIESAALKPGEDEKLEELFARMNSAQRTLSALSKVDALLFEGTHPASEAVDEGSRLLAQIAGENAELEGLSGTLSDVDALLCDLKRELNSYRDELDFSPEEYHETSGRLDTINGIKAKYGGTIENVNKALREYREKLSMYENYEEAKERAQRELERSKKALVEAADKLTEFRKKAARSFEDKLSNALLSLNFNQVRFEVVFGERDEPEKNGADDVEFFISTNPGSPIAPLGRVASGGELSRIMLGIKTLDIRDAAGTIIFDEIDTGISGKTAHLVSEKLKSISAGAQLLCITHLPQIAARADVHLLIEKTVSEGTTSVSAKRLDHEGSVMELSRLLAGDRITDAVIENARELKEVT